MVHISVIPGILKLAPTLTDLFHLLPSIDRQWYQLGIGLNVSLIYLEEVERSVSSSHRRLLQVLEIWMTTTESHLITWKTIISVIEGPLINNRRLADEIYDYLTKGKFLAYKSIYTQFACSFAIQ